MIASGIVDPTKVTRSSLINAASVAACVLTTESLVADKPDPAADAAASSAGFDRICTRSSGNSADLYGTGIGVHCSGSEHSHLQYHT